MRPSIPILGCALGALLLSPGWAEPQSEAPASYIAAGSEVSYRVARAPLATGQLGARAAAQLDPGAELPPVLGDAAAALEAGWIERGLGAGAARGAMPLAARPQRGTCDCATEIADASKQRVAALYLERDFEVGSELDGLHLLELRARYRDGIVIAVNGREVARRNVEPDDPRMGPARRPRGPELETFYIPVTSGLLHRGRNRLSIEVRPWGNRAAPRIDFELRPRRGAAIVRGPILQRVSERRATILFDTDLPTHGSVRWKSGGRRGVARSAGGGLALHHRVQLGGLEPGAAVHYQVVAGGDASPEYLFHAAPARGEPIRFAVYGDMRGGHAVHHAITEAILSEAPDFVVVTGDLVLRGSDAGDWQRFFSVGADLMARVPYYPAAGNHDVGLSGAEHRRMNEQFALWPGPKDRPPWGHWYSFDVADLHFVVLDSNAYEQPAQLAWLERDLAAARDRKARAIFAVTHDGPYSRGLHRGNRYAAEKYAPVLAKHHVAMLFAGHDHLYQRGEVGGLRYIVSGGGGASLYPIRCGVRGRPRCKVDDGMKKVVRAHHYVAVEVYAKSAHVCPRRPDRTPLEPCIDIPLD